MSTTKIILSNNRLIRPEDYTNTFGVSRKTANKMLRDDKEECRIKRFMVSHFIQIYDVPPRKFNPKYVCYEAAKMTL